MMKRYLCVALLVLAAYASAVPCQALIMMQYSLPDLAARAEVIAEGQVTVENGTPFLSVQEVLKGHPADRLRLVSRGFGFTEPTTFTQGERVVVFIDKVDPDGTAALVGYGDQGKWPRPENSSYFHTIYRGLPLEKTVSVIKGVLHALSGKDFEEQGLRIKNMLQSKDEVLQLAGLETALSMTLSESLPTAKRSESIAQIAAFSLDLLVSPNPGVRGRAIHLIGYAPDLVVTRALSPMVSDPDPHIRRWAITEVTAARYLPSGDPTYQARKPGSPAQEKALADAEKQKWIALYEQNRDAQIANLRKSLKSSSPLEREAAAIYLRYLKLEGTNP